jgi:putative ABC transport system ATP-binding protein
VTVIDAEQITKVYRDGAVETTVVNAVSLSVAAGEMVAIVGPSGSGKTTLLSMIGCILRASSGAITLCGRRVDQLGEAELPIVRRRHIGFVFQSFNLFAALTAAENVEALLNLKGLSGRPARREAVRLLGAVGLEGRADSLPRTLSGGEKQRVSIARAMAGDPPVILADEPTANLDTKNGEQVMRLLHRAAKSRDRAVVIVTHDHRVLPYIDRVVHLADGCLTVANGHVDAQPRGTAETTTGLVTERDGTLADVAPGHG